MVEIVGKLLSERGCFWIWPLDALLPSLDVATTLLLITLRLNTEFWMLSKFYVSVLQKKLYQGQIYILHFTILSTYNDFLVLFIPRFFS
jgi:hypothetical protein